METKIENLIQKNTLAYKITVYESFQAMEIRLKLVMAVEDNMDTIALGIRSMLASEAPLHKILMEIKEMANADYSYMSQLIGAALLDSIMNY